MTVATAKLAAYVRLYKGHRTVLLRRSAACAFRPHEYTLVAGRVNPGEVPLAAAIRELKEEVGVTADDLTEMGQVHFVRTMLRLERQPDGTADFWVDFLYSAHLKHGAEPRNTEPDIHDHIAVVPLNQEGTVDLSVTADDGTGVWPIMLHQVALLAGVNTYNTSAPVIRGKPVTYAERQPLK